MRKPATVAAVLVSRKAHSGISNIATSANKYNLLGHFSLRKHFTKAKSIAKECERQWAECKNAPDNFKNWIINISWRFRYG